jgi:Cd2+/Zn2+-exporting ATPase
MSVTVQPQKDGRSGQCLARSAADAFAADPTLEAITIDRARKTISVATLGRTNEPEVSERIRSTIEIAQQGDTEGSCSLLSGKGDCRDCAQPLSESERRRITIQHGDSSTTIARVTCPTAPSFWRWRDIPWPKVVQRDVEFLEHADEIDEWKGQLAAALLCGACGLLGWMLRGSPGSMIAYGAAYLAGKLVYGTGGLGTFTAAGDRCAFPDVGGGVWEREHRCLG